MNGNELKNQGMQLALFNADKKTSGWSQMALDALIEYIKKYPHTSFQAEDIRTWAKHNGLPDPPSKRAWGAVIVMAKNKELIRFDGYRRVTNPKAHRTPAAVWRKC